MNGDEAMCFGSAFIASNSSTNFKVKQVYLTQNPDYDVHIKISPLNSEDALSEDEQRAEGIDEEDIIKYTQEFKLFNTSDYLGKSKGLSLNYNRDMKIELFREDGDNMILLDTFKLTKVKEQIANAISTIQKERDAAKKKADKEKAKKANETAEGEDKKEEVKEEKEDDTPQEAIKTPKLKVSIEFSRSGLMSVTKATVGTHFVDIEQERKPSQLSSDNMRAAKSRLNWYTQRDLDKQKTDMARNEFEAMIYKFKDWLRDDENAPYCEEDFREA